MPSWTTDMVRTFTSNTLASLPTDSIRPSPSAEKGCIVTWKWYAQVSGVISELILDLTTCIFHDLWSSTRDYHMALVLFANFPLSLVWVCLARSTMPSSRMAKAEETHSVQGRILAILKHRRCQAEWPHTLDHWHSCSLVLCSNSSPCETSGCGCCQTQAPCLRGRPWRSPAGMAMQLESQGKQAASL